MAKLPEFEGEMGRSSEGMLQSVECEIIGAFQRPRGKLVRNQIV
jgi:hypothetical protein